MESAIPLKFDEDFFDWFRERTEAAWSLDPPRGPWQQGTRWLGGLDDGQIANIEDEWGLRFPPDYRLFLSHLHALDRPMRFWDQVSPAEPTKRLPRDVPAFCNWLIEADCVCDRYDFVVEGLQFDVENANLWRPSWGACPSTVEERAQRVREVVAQAPKLIPVFSHRFLLAQPCRASNPVFSIYQSDIIIYGADLHDYFLNEFADVLGIDQDTATRDAEVAINAQYLTFTTIPFWGDLLEAYKE